MVDNRLLDIGRPTLRELRQQGLGWFAEGENADYLAPELLRLSEAEMEQFRTDTNRVYSYFVEAARHIARYGLWESAGIPPQAVELVQYSLENELGNHLIGRFDYAGGLGKYPLKMLEFNADTFSLLPESTHIQRQQFGRLNRRHQRQSGQFNRILALLTEGFHSLLDKYPDNSPTLLLSGLGHPEDELNLSIIREAALQAGFADVQQQPLEAVVFSPEEGIFTETEKGEYLRFDFWFKMVPWDFIAHEEPELLSILTQITRQKRAVILNPAYSMLLQSKGLLPFLQEVAPHHPSLLRTSRQRQDIAGHSYAVKPFFGRTGDNVQIFTGRSYPTEKKEGDYGHLPMAYQELARFEQDEDGDIYQPSLFWAGGEAAGFCLRRQDSLIVDDEAEFVGHILQEGNWTIK